MAKTWNNRPIEKPSDYNKLEDMAVKFELTGLHPDEANDAAYKRYQQDMHAEAAKHHFEHYRNAVVTNQKDLAEIHKLFWKKHAEKAGATEADYQDNNLAVNPQLTTFQTHKYDSKLV